MHMFEDTVMQDFSCVKELADAGVNEFVFDFSALDSKYLPVLLNEFLFRNSDRN